MVQMLRRDGGVHIFDQDAKSTEEPAGLTEGISLARALRALADHRRLLSLATGSAVLLGLVYLALIPARYSASSLMFIDLHSRGVLGSSGSTASDPNVDSANIESQIEMLKSEHVLLKLVEAEHLVDNPDFAPSSFESLYSGAGRLLTFWQTRPPPAPITRSVAVARALQKVTSARRVGLTYTVEVTATMSSPTEAAKVANAYANAYISDQSERREDSARRASELLRQRTAELQSQTADSERAVEDLKFSGSLAGANSASARVSLQRLESTARSYRLLHDKFLDRYTETWQQSLISLPDAQVVSEAFPPAGKSGPRSTTILAIALFIGFSVGLMMIALRDRRILGFTR